MRMMRSTAMPALAAVALLGCSGGGEPDNAAGNDDLIGVLPPDESVATPTQDLATGVIDTPPRPTAIAPNQRTEIAAAFHGRWGLTPAACASERDDTDGLVTISGATISFHDMVARPAKIYTSAPTRIHAEFAFDTRDGRSWTGPMIWSVEGRQLVRVDSEPDSRLVYTRC